MSYVDAPRIHFFGRYFANPSTINRTLSNDDLRPPLVLAWNPGGSASFYFRDCKVSSAVGLGGPVAGSAADHRILVQTWIRNGCPEGEDHA
jgi:hypothetical protein